MYKTLKDTFNAFDKDGNAELGYPEYQEAWKFLGQPGTDEDIKKAFDSVDIDASGLVEWDEFVFSIMGEAALKYGTLADMEKLTTLLDATMKDYAMIQDALSEARANNDTRATRNAELRDRLENMKGDVQSTVNGLIAQMMNIDPRDVLSEAEIDHHLETAFTKFDKDNSGELGDWEFKQAWSFLGLKGSEREVADAFLSVDKNNSGLIDMTEFKTAIKSERMAELSLTAVLEKMGVNLANQHGEFDAFKAAAQRRRLMKKTYEENVMKLTKEIIEKLAMMSKREIPRQNEEDENVYNTLKDTYNAFDKDGTGEMAYEEYVEAWKFLGRGTDEAEIEKTFNSVDVDGSGLIEWNEFVFSLMGKKAMNFGALAQLEILNNLLIDTSGLLSAMRQDLDDAHLSAEERAARNAYLGSRLEGRDATYIRKRLCEDVGHRWR
jgi:Ca2+-binding EF-hand superfamily protein